MLPSLTEKDLSPYFNREDLILQAAEQLKKDLAQHGFDIEYGRDHLHIFSELFMQTEPFIRKLISTHYEKLLQLLYRIDVSEELIARAVNEGGNISEEITRLILYRELQKVVIDRKSVV